MMGAIFTARDRERLCLEREHTQHGIWLRDAESTGDKRAVAFHRAKRIELQRQIAELVDQD